MDEDTRKTLAFMGWREEPGVDAMGKPYIAFVRNGHYFHVTLDSRRELKQTRVSYGNAGRRANQVVTWERSR